MPSEASLAVYRLARRRLSSPTMLAPRWTQHTLKPPFPWSEERNRADVRRSGPPSSDSTGDLLSSQLLERFKPHDDLSAARKDKGTTVRILALQCISTLALTRHCQR
jgi:hypothetical protein